MVTKTQSIILAIICVIVILFNIFYNIPNTPANSPMWLVPYISIAFLVLGLMGAILNITDVRTPP